jgi:hypothetical protein
VRTAAVDLGMQMRCDAMRGDAESRIGDGGGDVLAARAVQSKAGAGGIGR